MTQGRESFRAKWGGVGRIRWGSFCRALRWCAMHHATAKGYGFVQECDWDFSIEIFNCHDFKLWYLCMS